MKLNKKLCLLPLGLIFTSCSNLSSPITYGLYKAKIPNSLVSDAYYLNGFALSNVDNANPYFVHNAFDYNGEAETDSLYLFRGNSYWTLCQWWAPEEDDFINASYSKDGNKHIYENYDRYFSVDTLTSEVKLNLNADSEYQKRFGGARPVGANWSHHLIEQHFAPGNYIPVKDVLDKGKDLYIKYDVSIDKCDYLGDEPAKESETAQLLCYFMVKYCPMVNSSRQAQGGFPQIIWFGVPVFDYRYSHTWTYISEDSGQVGATGAFVYNLDSSLYIGEQYQLNHTYNVDFAIGQYIKTAYEVGRQRGYLEGTSYEDMCLGYISFGWEITGEFDCATTVKNLDAYIK